MGQGNARGAGSAGDRPTARAVADRPSGRGLAERLHAAAIHLLRRVRRTDARMGLSPARASALSVLVFGGPRSIGQLAEAEQVRPPTMTRLVTGLEAEGWVERLPDPRDGRAVIVRATRKGRRVLERGRRLRVAQIEAMVSELTAAEVETLLAAVDLLERGLSRPSGGGEPE